MLYVSFRTLAIYDIAAGQVFERQAEHVNQSRKWPHDKNDVSHENMKLKP